MTHEYTLLVGGTVIRGEGLPDATAIAWAGDTVLAIGSDAEVRAISRGDSRVALLDGAFVIPLNGDDEPHWPPTAALEVGGPASMAILRDDPRTAGSHAGSLRSLAVLRLGRVLSGELPPRHGTTARHREG